MIDQKNNLGRIETCPVVAGYFTKWVDESFKDVTMGKLLGNLPLPQLRTSNSLLQLQQEIVGS